VLENGMKKMKFMLLKCALRHELHVEKSWEIIVMREKYDEKSPIYSPFSSASITLVLGKQILWSNTTAGCTNNNPLAAVK